MKVLDKYKKLKNEIIEYKERKVELENHDIPDSNVYRIHYIRFHNGSKVLSTQYISYPFKMKSPMTQEEVLDIISFLYDQVYLITGTNPNSFAGARLLDLNILNYDKFNFTRVDDVDTNKVIDLYIIDRNKKTFKKSKYYDNYFDWYKPGVSYEKVEAIYKKYGIELYKKPEHVLEM